MLDGLEVPPRISLSPARRAASTLVSTIIGSVPSSSARWLGWRSGFICPTGLNGPSGLIGRHMGLRRTLGHLGQQMAAVATAVTTHSRSTTSGGAQETDRTIRSVDLTLDHVRNSHPTTLQSFGLSPLSISPDLATISTVSYSGSQLPPTTLSPSSSIGFTGTPYQPLTCTEELGVSVVQTATNTSASTVTSQMPSLPARLLQDVVMRVLTRDLASSAQQNQNQSESNRIPRVISTRTRSSSSSSSSSQLSSSKSSVWPHRTIPSLFLPHSQPTDIATSIQSPSRLLSLALSANANNTPDEQTISPLVYALGRPAIDSITMTVKEPSSALSTPLVASAVRAPAPILSTSSILNRSSMASNVTGSLRLFPPPLLTSSDQITVEPGPPSFAARSISSDCSGMGGPSGFIGGEGMSALPRRIYRLQLIPGLPFRFKMRFTRLQLTALFDK
ncbi:unnamed protein product [Protopolystoma xenopodis]|uniref:Uncharacterized protein n=1 Tax=Protopolystoma xenopodis TaxID=117903 RepID=A0A448WL00_9PLAT|nr:unnamed protein product [Protopolystoma xenopodis]